MAETPVDPPPSCTNCFEPLPAPRPRFCPHCGQETTLRPPKIGEFIQQFGGAFISTEGALWSTLALLLFKPGELTRQYLAGRRKHYVLPLRLYLTISVIVLLMMRVLASVNVNADLATIDPKDVKQFRIELGVGRAGLENGKFFCTGLPQWLCKRLQSRLDVDSKALQREATEFGGRFIANLGTAMFVLLPLYAMWLKLAWIGRRLRYTEHLVCALHLHALWFLMAGVMAAGPNPIVAAAFFAMPVYTLIALKRVYGGRWWGVLLRSALVALLYLISLGVVMAGLALYTFLF